MNYYLLFIEDGIDPEVHGPYPSEEVRDGLALNFRKEFGKDHGIYPLDIDGPGKPKMEAYSGGFFMEKGN